MNVAVCVKQIPDPAVPGSLSADHTLDRSGKLILDESDSYGVEMALRAVDAARGGEVRFIDGRRTTGVRPAHRAADGAPPGDPGVRPRARRVRRAGRPPRCSRRASSAPATSISCSRRRSRPTATRARCPRRSPRCWVGLRSPFEASPEIVDGKGWRCNRARFEAWLADEVEAHCLAYRLVTAGVAEPRYPPFWAGSGRRQEQALVRQAIVRSFTLMCRRSSFGRSGIINVEQIGARALPARGAPGRRRYGREKVAAPSSS